MPTRPQLRHVAVVLAIAAAAACGNTMRGIKADSEKAAEKTAAGVETMDVKAALIAAGRVDGTVPSAEQKATAETITREQAKVYPITNQLTMAPK